MDGPGTSPAEERCAFCGQGPAPGGCGGPLAGPFMSTSMGSFQCHVHCALYSPRVTLSPYKEWPIDAAHIGIGMSEKGKAPAFDGSEGRTVAGLLLSVEDEVLRGRKTPCTTCGRRGATVGCWHKGCVRTCHLPCALQDGWQVLYAAGACLPVGRGKRTRPSEDIRSARFALCSNHRTDADTKRSAPPEGFWPQDVLRLPEAEQGRFLAGVAGLRIVKAVKMLVQRDTTELVGSDTAGPGALPIVVSWLGQEGEEVRAPHDIQWTTLERQMREALLDLSASRVTLEDVSDSDIPSLPCSEDEMHEAAGLLSAEDAGAADAEPGTLGSLRLRLSFMNGPEEADTCEALVLAQTGLYLEKPRRGSDDFREKDEVIAVRFEKVLPWGTETGAGGGTLRQTVRRMLRAGGTDACCVLGIADASMAPKWRGQAKALLAHARRGDGEVAVGVAEDECFLYVVPGVSDAARCIHSWATERVGPTEALRVPALAALAALIVCARRG